MYTIEKETIYEQIIKKSVFITQLFPVESIDEINEILRVVRKTHYEATHNCYAYIIGDNGEYFKASDDGEPSQTAGVVIYEVLKKNNLTNVLCIVTRYYGGIKLGAGGLIRAYGSSATGVLKEAIITEIIPEVNILIVTDYQHVDMVINAMNQYTIIDKIFLEKINLKYTIPEADFQEIESHLINITKNNIKIEVL